MRKQAQKGWETGPRLHSSDVSVCFLWKQELLALVTPKAPRAQWAVAKKLESGSLCSGLRPVLWANFTRRPKPHREHDQRQADKPH